MIRQMIRGSGRLRDGASASSVRANTTRGAYLYTFFRAQELDFKIMIAVADLTTDMVPALIEWMTMDPNGFLTLATTMAWNR